MDFAEEAVSVDSTWRRTYSSVAELSQKVVDVLDDQSRKGQLLKLSKTAARARFPKLTVASLGAMRKDKPGSIVTARVLFNGTHGV